MKTPDQIVDDFVHKVQDLQKRYAETPGLLPHEVHRVIVEGMTIVSKGADADTVVTSELLPSDPVVLSSLINRYDTSKFSLCEFEFVDPFQDAGYGKIKVGTIWFEDVLFDTWRRTIEVRPETTERTVLLASDQEHLLDLLLFIQQTQIAAAEQMIPSLDMMISDEWILEAGRIGGGEGVSIYFARG